MNVICASTTAASSSGASQYSMIIMLLLIFVIFWLFMIRPENKRKKKLEEMRNALGVGDEIVTIGGITGKVVQATEDTITFETGEDRVRIEITKWAVSSNEGKGANKETSDSEESLGN